MGSVSARTSAYIHRGGLWADVLIDGEIVVGNMVEHVPAR
jgi:hypothetical protein